jgi:hypothetical protein
MTFTAEFVEAFWRRVDKSGPMIRPELGQCWEWRGWCGARGYGMVHVPRDITTSAHRVAFMIEHGISSVTDLDVCHMCDYPPCVRPSHLFTGTAQANADDMMRKGRWWHPKSRPRSAKALGVKPAELTKP